MKIKLILLFALLPFFGVSQIDAILDYTENNFPEASKKFVYGSVVRSAINLISENEEDVKTFKNIDALVYISVENEDSDISLKKEYDSILDLVVENNLTEFMSVTSAGIPMVPDAIKNLVANAKEFIIYSKDTEGLTEELTVLIRNKDQIQIIIMDGTIELAKIMKIKIKEGENILDTFDIINIF